MTYIHTYKLKDKNNQIKSYMMETKVSNIRKAVFNLYTKNQKHRSREFKDEALRRSAESLRLDIGPPAGS